jgi:protein tyrosine phosphatase
VAGQSTLTDRITNTNEAVVENLRPQAAAMNQRLAQFRFLRQLLRVAAGIT